MKDNLENKFKALAGQFDTEEPKLGHFDRFEVRLARLPVKKKTWNPNTWKWLAIAASIALLISVGIGNYPTKQGLELADVSPKMEETQNFFVSTIQNEVKQINLKRNDNNKKVIDDAMIQLKKLENNYELLTVELEATNKDNRIIYAMISNFQQRIEVLKYLLVQLDEIEQLKNTQNEKTIT